MRRPDSAVWWVAGVWTAVALVLLAQDWLMEAAPVAALLSLPLMGILALATLIGSAWTGRWPLLAVSLIGLTGLLFSPLPRWGGALWFRISFERHRPAYDAIVARADHLPIRGKIGDAPYWIEHGPPVRVAFRQPVGVADNWGAVVHDPSGGVATARGWGTAPGDFTVRPDLQELWGGDLLSCSRITGHYYRCWFT